MDNLNPGIIPGEKIMGKETVQEDRRIMPLTFTIKGLFFLFITPSALTII